MSTTNPSVHTQPAVTHRQHPAPPKQRRPSMTTPRHAYGRDRTDKDQIIAVHAQVNSSEQQLREPKTEVRLGAFEENVSAQPAPSSNRDGSSKPQPRCRSATREILIKPHAKNAGLAPYHRYRASRRPFAFLQLEPVWNNSNSFRPELGPGSRGIVNGAFELSRAVREADYASMIVTV